MPLWLFIALILIGFVAFGFYLNRASTKYAAESDRMTPEERAEFDDDRAW